MSPLIRMRSRSFHLVSKLKELDCIKLCTGAYEPTGFYMVDCYSTNSSHRIPSPLGHLRIIVGDGIQYNLRYNMHLYLRLIRQT